MEYAGTKLVLGISRYLAGFYNNCSNYGHLFQKEEMALKS